MGENRHILGARRTPKLATAKVTIELDAEAEALLRITAREWRLPLGGAIGLALRCFVGSGWAEQRELTVGQEGVARIDAALERWRMASEQPVLDPCVHTSTGTST